MGFEMFSIDFAALLHFDFIETLYMSDWPSAKNGIWKLLQESLVFTWELPIDYLIVLLKLQYYIFEQIHFIDFFCYGKAYPSVVHVYFRVLTLLLHFWRGYRCFEL